VVFWLKECVIELGAAEAAAYAQLAEWLPTTRSVDELRSAVGMDEAKLTRFVTHLAAAGLLYKKGRPPGRALRRGVLVDPAKLALKAFSNSSRIRTIGTRSGSRVERAEAQSR